MSTQESIGKFLGKVVSAGFSGTSKMTSKVIHVSSEMFDKMNQPGEWRHGRSARGTPIREQRTNMFGGKKVYYDFQQYREEAPEREKQQQERIRAKFMEIVDCLVSEGGQKHFFSIDKSGGMEISSTNPGTSKSITIAPIGSSREFAMKTILEAVEFLSKKK